MKDIYKIIVALLIVTSSLHAQEKLQLSMQQAQEFAVQNRYDIKAKQYDLQIAEKRTKESKQAYIPEVKATAYVHYSPQIQATLIPAGFVGSSEASLLAIGAKSVSIYGLELNQPVYQPGLRTDIKLAQSNQRMEQQRLHLQETEIRKQICYAYLNTLLRELQLQIATQEEKRYENYSMLAKGRYDNGALIENDYLRANLDYENAQQQARISKQNYEQSLVTLKYQLNVSDSTTIVLTDKLGVQNQEIAIVPDFAAAENRTEYKLLKLDEEHNQLLEKKQKQAALPTVSFMANYSQQYLNDSFNYDYSNSQLWTPFSGFGFQLSVPLTDHISNKTAVNRIKLEKEKISAKQEQQKKDILYQIEHEAAEITNASNNYARSKKNYELSQQIYNNQKQQLELGAFSYDAILDTENSVTNAEKNFIQASYNYIVAQLEYDIAIGKL